MRVTEGVLLLKSLKGRLCSRRARVWPHVVSSWPDPAAHATKAIIDPLPKEPFTATLLLTLTALGWSEGWHLPTDTRDSLEKEQLTTMRTNTQSRWRVHGSRAGYSPHLLLLLITVQLESENSWDSLKLQRDWKESPLAPTGEVTGVKWLAIIPSCP